MTPFHSFITLALFTGMVFASIINAGMRELRVESNLKKRYATNTCSDDNQAEFVSDSYYEGRIFAANAINYLNNYGASDSAFVAYFGTDAQAISGPLSVFTNVTNSYTVTLSCDDPALVCEQPDMIAYSFAGAGEIHYCSPFYSQSSTARLCDMPTVNDLDSVRGGTTLIELVHTLDWISDGGGGCSKALELAKQGYSIASANAANYSCFALQAFANSQCGHENNV